MTGKDIERMRDAAIEVCKIHQKHNVCGIRPRYEFDRHCYVPTVHLTESCFLEAFRNYERVEFCGSHDKIYAKKDGVEFFALVDISKLENGENHD